MKIALYHSPYRRRIRPVYDLTDKELNFLRRTIMVEYLRRRTREAMKGIA